MNLKTLFRTKSIPEILKAAELEKTHGVGQGTHLKRTLGVLDLTFLGIAAVVGAGIFSTIGNAANAGGPAVVFLFIFTAIACAFSALCYAEFAAALPISGSAYTYAYASLGEVIAWIIGWDLLLEYAIGNIAVAISWSDYFTSILTGYGIHLPSYLTMDFLSASRGYDQVMGLLNEGVALGDLAAKGISQSVIEGYQAWSTAPRFLGLPFICDIPALAVVALVTWIVYIGIQESKRVSNTMVIIKLAILAVVIGLGAFYIRPENWVPFAPNGASGVLKGVSAVFFAYIGFDAISTTAEECKNPQRDLPRAMFYSLAICTLLYCLVALVLTGMTSYTKLAVGDPLAFVFGPEGANIPWISGVIALSAIVAIFGVLLVFQIGQPRLWMVMSRDGLLPPIFSALHPKYATPWFSTLLAGALVAIPSLFMNLTEVTDLTSIGTLFAFVLVCAGVLRFDPHRPKEPGKFRVPYVNAKFIFPGLLVLLFVLGWIFNPEGYQTYFNLSGGWETFQHKIPIGIYGLAMIYIGYLTFKKNWSLIPLLGLSSCGYLMTELGITNWIRFGVWLVIGCFVYFLYGIKHSKANR